MGYHKDERIAGKACVSGSPNNMFFYETVGEFRKERGDFSERMV